MNALNVLCAQLTRDLFAIAKFLFFVGRLYATCAILQTQKCDSRHRKHRTKPFIRLRYVHDAYQNNDLFCLNRIHLPGVATPVLLKHFCIDSRLQSSKKPIRDCFHRCRPFLKRFTVLAFTVWWSKLFHLLISRSVKKCRLTSNLLLCLVSFFIQELRWLNYFALRFT